MVLPAIMGGAVGGTGSVAQKLTSAMTPKPATTTTPSPTNASSMGTTTTPSGTSYSNDEITSAAPLYSGPHVAPIPHVASALGASYTHNANDGTYNVNGQTVKPTSIVNGVGHAPVTQLAQVSGHPMSLVSSNSKGTTVMPNTSANTSPIPQLNQYWTNVQKAGGAYANPTANGMTLQQQVQNEANMYKINPSQVQVVHEPDGSVRTFVPWNLVQAHAVAASNPQPAQPAQQAQQQPAYDPMTALQANQGQFLQNMYASEPQAPTLQPMPTLDTSQFQPFQFDMGGDYTNVYNSLNPSYQQQMATADQKINDAMNRRGIYTSGIAQQAVNQNDQTMAQNEWNAVNKQVTSDQGNALKAWQDNNTNHLNAYKAQLDAAKASGQLTDQEYANAINEWGKLVSAQTAMSGQDASLIGKTLPYTMGPTPDQLATLSGVLPNGQPTLQAQQDAFNNALNYFKTTAPYSQLTADQQAQLALNYYKANLPYNSMTQYQQGQLSLGGAKLQAQMQQWQAMDNIDISKNNLTAAQLSEKTAYDQQLINDAQTQITDTQTNDKLNAIKGSLQTLATTMDNLRTMSQSVPPDMAKQYQDLLTQAQTLITSATSFPSLGN